MACGPVNIWRKNLETHARRDVRSKKSPGQMRLSKWSLCVSRRFPKTGKTEEKALTKRSQKKKKVCKVSCKHASVQNRGPASQDTKRETHRHYVFFNQRRCKSINAPECRPSKARTKVAMYVCMPKQIAESVLLCNFLGRCLALFPFQTRCFGMRTTLTAENVNCPPSSVSGSRHMRLLVL